MASAEVMNIQPMAVQGGAPGAIVPAMQASGTGPSTSKGSSLWVGELAADVNEAKLYEFFNPIAAVQSVRVCRSAMTKESLGYAYVNFQTPADAEAAMEQRNYNELNGRVIRIMWAQRDPINRRSNVGNVVVKRLPGTFSDRALNDIFKEFGTILSVKIARDEKGASKGYGFVHFDSERAAKDAIEMVNGTELEGGKKVLVESFVPRTQRQSAPDKWTNVYAKNVPKSYSDDALMSLFAAYGPITSAVIMRDDAGKSKGFAFVCFTEHESAVKAQEALNEKDVDTLPNLTADDLVTARREDAPTKKEEKEEKKGASTPDGPKPKVKLYVGKAMKKSERERANKEKLEAAKRERQAKFHGCNLFVRNLDDSVDDEALRREFAPFGTITSAKVSREVDGRSRGHGFVCFETPESASKAQSAMNRKLVSGKPLFVALWEPKEVRVARFNASQAQAGGFGGRGRGGMAGMQGGQGMANAQNAGMAPNMASLMTMAMNPQMVLHTLMTMASTNPQLAQQFQRMDAPTMAQMMQAYLAQVQQMARQGMAGQGMGGMPGQGMSPTAGAGGARGPAQAGAVNRNGMQQFGGFMGAINGQVPAGMAGQPRGAGRTNRLPGQQGAPAAGTPPGAARVATGPMGGAPGARGPVAGMPAGMAGARGPAATSPRPGAPGAPMPAGMQSGPRPGMMGGMPGGMGGMAANMQYRTAEGARNMPGMGMMPGMVDPAAAAAMMAGMQGAVQSAQTSAPGAPLTRDQFLSQLSGAEPQQRKNMIGEHLYTQVHARRPALAGKITGMLLDGMDDSELLVLLETPQELESRIAEAMEVLEQHKRQTNA